MYEISVSPSAHRASEGDALDRSTAEDAAPRDRTLQRGLLMKSPRVRVRNDELERVVQLVPDRVSIRRVRLEPGLFSPQSVS